MKAIDLPSPAYMARFMPKADPAPSAPRKRQRKTPSRDTRLYRPLADNPVVKAAIQMGRFTVLDVAKASGKTVQQARSIVYIMSLHGMIRQVEASSTVPSSYERTDGLSFVGRVVNPAKMKIAAMPIGARFGWADLPGTHSMKADAVLQSRRLGMIRRITFRRLFSTWEMSKC